MASSFILLVSSIHLQLLLNQNNVVCSESFYVHMTIVTGNTVQTTTTIYMTIVNVPTCMTNSAPFFDILPITQSSFLINSNCDNIPQAMNTKSVCVFFTEELHAFSYCTRVEVGQLIIWSHTNYAQRNLANNLQFMLKAT